MTLHFYTETHTRWCRLTCVIAGFGYSDEDGRTASRQPDDGDGGEDDKNDDEAAEQHTGQKCCEGTMKE